MPSDHKSQAEIDHALWGRMTAILVREGVRPRLATRLALALLPVVSESTTPPAGSES